MEAVIDEAENVTRAGNIRPGMTPLLDQSLLVKGIIIGLFTIPGAYAGRWVVRRTPIRLHTRFMEVFILCGAAYFLWEAGQGFGWL